MHEFFTYQGRLNRRPYFFRNLALGGMIKLLSDVPGAYKVKFSPPMQALIFVFLFATLVIAMYQIIKRLHDLDISGWWSLLSLIPIVNIGLGLYVLFVKGTEGANRYGEDPLSNSAGSSGAASPVWVVLLILALVAGFFVLEHRKALRDAQLEKMRAESARLDKEGHALAVQLAHLKQAQSGRQAAAARHASKEGLKKMDEQIKAQTEVFTKGVVKLREDSIKNQPK